MFEESRDNTTSLDVNKSFRIPKQISNFVLGQLTFSKQFKYIN